MTSQTSQSKPPSRLRESYPLYNTLTLTLKLTLTLTLTVTLSLALIWLWAP